MRWQIKYALANIQEGGASTATVVGDELIRISTSGKPDVLAAISAADDIDLASVTEYRKLYSDMDFLCGYRQTCVWHGDAIEYLQGVAVGWGNFGTLQSAVSRGDANTSSHKVYKFSDRLLRQLSSISVIAREFDRIHLVQTSKGATLRIAMIADYEPTADAVRTMWDRFGPFNVLWNINPNGTPSPEAVAAGEELRCKVVKWNELKEILNKA